MAAELEVGGRATSPKSASSDERAFFALVGPALRREAVHFRFDDREYRFGVEGDPIVVRILDPKFFGHVLSLGNLGLGECYMTGAFEIAHGSLERFLIALARAEVEKAVRSNPLNVLRLVPIYLRNMVRGRYRNVQSHYDIGQELFELFLGPGTAYSCGYALSADNSLADLQTRKFDRICRKLRLRPGDRLLDIGCGFGGLLIHAAKHYGVQCTGITIAHDHHRCAVANAAAAGVGDRIEIRFASHEELGGPYDKIVSVGMFEHLTRRDYPVFFGNVKRALTKDGLGLLHTVGCAAAKNRHDPFIQKYMLPGSRAPKLSELAAQLEAHDMPILDVENIARHYAPTLRRWKENFTAAYPKLDHNKYDETFRLMFEYFITCCIAAATATEATVFQVLFANNFSIDMPFERV